MWVVAVFFGAVKAFLSLSAMEVVGFISIRAVLRPSYPVDFPDRKDHVFSGRLPNIPKTHLAISMIDRVLGLCYHATTGVLRLYSARL